MDILVSGASGFLGSALRSALSTAGHRVSSLVRRPPKSSAEIQWSPGISPLDPSVVDGVDAVINLCGAGLGARPWTRAYKETLYSSRLEPVHTLVTAMNAASTPPKTFLSTSATGFYGQHGSTPADESTPAGNNSLLADICRQWEAAALAAPERTRTVLPRTSVILAPHGGALGKLLLPLRAGLGGPLGSGQQYWPWLTLTDYVAAMSFLLDNEVRGPVNLSSPEPATVAALVRALGRELHRPTALRVPAFALRLGLGEMADEMLLTSTLVTPRRLLDAGFTFEHPSVAAAAAWVARGR